MGFSMLSYLLVILAGLVIAAVFLAIAAGIGLMKQLN
jgi:hypothetical protein